jgi:hypothetical protein
MRLIILSSVNRSNKTAEEKAVDLQRPISRSDRTYKREVIYPQRPIVLFHLL